MNLPALDRPAFVLDEAAFRQNLSLIADVAARADVEIILALKAFANWRAFGIVAEYLPSATASSLNEALLVARHMGVPPHVYAPAYVPSEWERLADTGSHFTFNSLGELERYRERWESRGLSVGLRVNPLYGPVATALYNPASPVSRLGESVAGLPTDPPRGLSGVHVHTLCESSAEQTAELIARVEQDLAGWLPRLRWLNLGGGHLMTREDYDLELLVAELRGLRRRHPHLAVTLEPGSAHAWRAGVLVAHVLDIIANGGVETLMLDVSFTCHMPDTLEMPYRPVVRGASAEAIDGHHPYRLGGTSCLAGDYLEAYFFPERVSVGDQLVLEDMLHYTTVKSTMFNGVAHPDFAVLRPGGELEITRRFDFADYEARMG